jgi:hypothetical protein
LDKRSKKTQRKHAETTLASQRSPTATTATTMPAMAPGESELECGNKLLFVGQLIQSVLSNKSIKDRNTPSYATTTRLPYKVWGTSETVTLSVVADTCCVIEKSHAKPRDRMRRAQQATQEKLAEVGFAVDQE